MAFRSTEPSLDKTRQARIGAGSNTPGTEGQPQPAPLAPGDELGTYRIVKRIGAGGMGEIYQAKHRTLGRTVAIKVLNAEAASRPDLVLRLASEAKVVTEIGHENIVEVLDFVSDPQGFSYYVMELLHGQDLHSTRNSDGPFPLQRSLAIIHQVCSALLAAHEKGVVHRDLKPENVFLIQRPGRKDFVKVLDFGLAKVLPREAGSDTGITEPGVFSPLTAVGQIMGTPEYMSPEQAQGQAVDSRTDIYALGVMMYWMLADRLPFEGDTIQAQLRLRVVGNPTPLPPITAAGEPIRRSLATVVMRCLSRELSVRYQNMDEILAALLRVQDAKASVESTRISKPPSQSPEQPFRPPPAETAAAPTPRSRLPLILLSAGLVVALVVAAALGGALWASSHAVQVAAPAPVPQPAAPTESPAQPPRDTVAAPAPAPAPPASPTLPPLPAVPTGEAAAAGAPPRPTPEKTPKTRPKKTPRSVASPPPKSDDIVDPYSE